MSSPSSDHYETLGVARDSKVKDIKSAFLKLSKETHPDVGGKTANVERFKRISEAARYARVRSCRTCSRYNDPTMLVLRS